MADTGQDKSIRVREFGCFIRRRYFHAESPKCRGDRRNIAGTIVDQNDVHSNSFVLGSTFRNRLSRDTAKRSARANALNTAST